MSNATPMLYDPNEAEVDTFVAEQGVEATLVHWSGGAGLVEDGVGTSKIRPFKVNVICTVGSARRREWYNIVKFEDQATSPSYSRSLASRTAGVISKIEFPMTKTLCRCK
jgi:hypothetical protein